MINILIYKTIFFLLSFRNAVRKRKYVSLRKKNFWFIFHFFHRATSTLTFHDVELFSHGVCVRGNRNSRNTTAVSEKYALSSVCNVFYIHLSNSVALKNNNNNLIRRYRGREKNGVLELFKRNVMCCSLSRHIPTIHVRDSRWILFRWWLRRQGERGARESVAWLYLGVNTLYTYFISSVAIFLWFFFPIPGANGR